MRFIREGRFGKAKQFKTGAVVGTYPKPLLVFSFDEGGLYVFPKKGTLPPKDGMVIDTFEDDIVSIKPTEFEEYTKKPTSELPKVLAVDFYSFRMGTLNDLYTPAGNTAGLKSFYGCLNLITKVCPWKTVVLDPITGLSEVIHAHVAVENPGKLKDMRKWTPDVGYQIQKTIGQLALVQAHTVTIMHENEQTSEEGNVTGVVPMIPSKFGRERVAGLLHQVFYAMIENGKPVVKTSNYGYVRGLGARWPANLPATCGADFKSIYGKEFGL